MKNKNGIRIEQPKKKREPLKGYDLEMIKFEKDGRLYMVPSFKHVVELVSRNHYREIKDYK